MSELRSPFRGGPLDRLDAERLATTLKALAEPSRLKILNTLAGGKATTEELTEVLGLAQPTVSHHMRVLVAAGTVTRERVGNHVWHELAPAGIGAVAEALRPGRAR